MRRRDNTGTITHNSFWYAVEASATTIVMLIASVPVARVMGPQTLGHYIYLVFLTNVAQRLANVGIPATTCKYMAEHLGRGQTGVARGIFRVTLRSQALIAAVVTSSGCVLVWLFAAPDYQLVSFLIVVSMWPAMVNNIPAQANIAAENLRANIPASFVNFISYSLIVVLTLVFRWGLVGLAAATLTSRTLEAVARYSSVHRWLAAFTPETPTDELRRRMFTFSRQNLALLALGLIVWDRSELLFLKHFCDVKQVAFYSVAFSITNQLLMAPRAFSSAIGTTVFAQFGRDRSALEGLIQNGTRYVGLLAIPLFLGLAAIAEPLIRLVYGPTYVAVIPVLWLLSVFAIPRAFQIHSENLLQATETQGFMVAWMGLSAIVNVTLDWLLIPAHGAIGAAMANGIAQTFAIAGVWVKASMVLSVGLPKRFLLLTGVCGAAMIAVVLPLGLVLPTVPALLFGVPAGVLAFGTALRVTGCLEREDWIRLSGFARRLPAGLQPSIEAGLRLLMPNAQQQPL
jgi:O-antigen/teichoic acid export membrane protein